MKGATADRRVTTSVIAGLALVALIVHLLTIHRYGYFRDELYYIACARHLDFGYVDLAPLSAFFLRIELIWFGVVVGFGIQNKHSMVFFAVALALATLLTPERRHLAQKWIWLGGLIAVVIALPNVIWQIESGWPTWVLL